MQSPSFSVTHGGDDSPDPSLHALSQAAMQRILMIVGPTAVGKTSIAVALATALDGEIVSLDSRGFYRGMDTATAKPTTEQRSRVPHHMIDIAEPNATVSLANLNAMLGVAIPAIARRGRLPILVGGTGQYMRAVADGWTPPPVPPNEALRRALEGLAHQRGADWLHRNLERMDPSAALKIGSRNIRRTVRALEVMMLTGRRFSEQQARTGPRYECVLIGLRRPREELYARIDARIDAMWDGGLLEETRRLLDHGFSPGLPSMSAIGYSQAVRFLQGELTRGAARAEMQRLTRALVRRQSNWFREDDASITWFDAGGPDVIAAIEAFVRRIWQHGPGGTA